MIKLLYKYFAKICQRDEEEVTMKDLRKSGADDKIKEWNKKYAGTEFAYTETDPKIYNLNKFVAEEMKQCWEKLGAGELNLFPEWWKLLKYEDVKWKEVPNEGNALATIENFAKGAQIWKLRFQEPPKFCVPCAIIHFDPDVRKYVYEQHPDGRVDSLLEWMGNNEVPRYDMSYLEYVEDDIHTGIWGNKEVYTYQLASHNLPDRPLTVLYVQQNVFYIEGLAQKFSNMVGLSKDKAVPVHSLVLAPLDKTSEVCTVLEG